MTYHIDGDISPLEETRWQHISCTYNRDKYVKGQYLAVDIPDPAIVEDIKEFPFKILQPQTFAKSIYLPKEVTIVNQNAQHRWTVILGNDFKDEGEAKFVYYKYFAGSFKDVRLWKTSRTDTELYSYRFSQVTAPQADLAGSLKFMNGSPFIFNEADSSSSSSLQFANFEKDLTLIKSSGEPNPLKPDLVLYDTNIICASDTYFSPQT